MNKILIYVLSVAAFFTSTAAAARPALSAESFAAQQPVALHAFNEGIQPQLKTHWLSNPIPSRKHIFKSISKQTGWNMQGAVEQQGSDEEWVDWELVDIMKDHLSLLGSSYLIFLSALTEQQLEALRNRAHYFVQHEELIPSKPRWQKDWSNLKTGLSNQTQVLHRLLAIEFLQKPYHVLEGARYNYVHYREQGMPPQRVEQLAQELPWFNACVQDTLTAVILNSKYTNQPLDMSKMFPILKAQRALAQNINQQVEEMKWEIGDKYIRSYLQTIRAEQTDQSLSLLERLRTQADVQQLPKQIDKVAKYCVAVRISAQSLQAYDEKYGAEKAN